MTLLARFISAGILFILLVNGVWSISASPLGLHLGARSITIAEAAPNGSITATVQLQASEAYCSWFTEASTLKERDDDITFPAEIRIPANSEALYQSLTSIQKAANERFGRQARISVFQLPLDISSSPMKLAVEKALMKTDFLAKTPRLLCSLPAKDAVRYAYGLETCEAVGLSEGCDYEEDYHMALSIELNHDSISFSLIDLGEESCADLAQQRIWLSNVASAHVFNPIQPTKSHDLLAGPITWDQNHSSRIEAELMQFIANNTVEEDMTEVMKQPWLPASTHIRAVTFFGDASPAAFSDLRSMLERTFASLPPGWLRDSIDPSLVMAVGAARRALHMQQDPAYFDYTLCGVGEDLEHEEL